MRAILSIAAASLILVACGENQAAVGGATTAPTCTTQITKTGVVEVCE